MKPTEAPSSTDVDQEIGQGLDLGVVDRAKASDGRVGGNAQRRLQAPAGWRDYRRSDRATALGQRTKRSAAEISDDDGEEPGRRVVDARGRVRGCVRVGLEIGGAAGADFLGGERNRDQRARSPRSAMHDWGMAGPPPSSGSETRTARAAVTRPTKARNAASRAYRGVAVGRVVSAACLIDLEQVSRRPRWPKPRQIPGPIRAPYLQVSRPPRRGEVTRTYPWCPPSGR